MKNPIIQNRKKRLEEARDVLARASQHPWNVEEPKLKSAIKALNTSDDADDVDTLLRLAVSASLRLYWIEEGDQVESEFFRNERLALEALYSRKTPQRIRSLKINLAHYEKEIRLAAADVLFELGVGEWQWKRNIKGDNTDFIKLAETGDDLFIEPLANTACFWNVPWAKKALETKTGNLHVVEVLYNYLCSVRLQERQNAAGILAKLGEPQWKEVIRGDEGDLKRIAESDNPQIIRLLPSLLFSNEIEEFSDTGGSIAKKYRGDFCRAIEKFGKSQNPLIAKTLIELLDHGSIEIRSSAASSLIEIAKTDFSLVSNEWKRASKLITRRHWQVSDHFDNLNCGIHSDRIDHTDSGIGLEIPKELRTPMTRRLIIKNPVKQYKIKGLIKRLYNKQEVTGKLVDAYEKNWIIHKVVKLKDPQAVEPLINVLIGKVEFVSADRAWVPGFWNIRALGRVKMVKPGEVDEIFVSRMRDYEVKQSAIDGLVELGDMRAVEPLIQILIGNDDQFRPQAALALGKLGARRAIEPLTLALCDPNGGVRKSAGQSLVWLGEKQWGRQYESGEYGETRWDVIEGDEGDFMRIGKLNNKQAVDVLLYAIKGNSAIVRKQAVEALLHTLEDPAGYARKQASETITHALGNQPECNWKQIVESLTDALKNPSGYVRKLAARCLIQFAKQDFSLVQGQWNLIADKITAPHKDRIDVIKVSKYDSYRLQHYQDKQQIHADTGIGLEIPPELKK